MKHVFEGQSSNQSNNSPSHQQNTFLLKARELAPLVEQEAASSEALGTMPPNVVEAMKEAGLFWMLVPSELGGGGGDVVTAIEVIEEVTRSDASTGWSLMANALATSAAGAFCTDEAVNEIFAADKLPILGGMLGPGGKSVEVPGGFKGSGRYKFGSGCGHADWIGAGVFVMDDHGPKLLHNGNPIVRVCFLPCSKVEMTQDWDVFGLVATGSYDYSVPEQFIPAEFTIERTETANRRGASHFKMGIAGLGCAGHSAVALGLMKRSLEELIKVASEKTRPGYKSVISENDVFRHEFSVNEANYQAVRSFTLQVFSEAQIAAETDTLSDIHRQRLHQVVVWSHKVAADVVKFCHMWAGSQSIGRSSILGRCMRDMMVATQHVFVDPISLTNAAPVIIDEWQRNSQ